MLAPALFAMEVPPTGERNGLDACCRYVGRQAASLTGKARDAYIFKNIAPLHARELEKRMEGKADTLVVLASQRSAVLLSLLTFRPDSALLIASDRDYEDMMASCGKEAGSGGILPFPPGIDYRVEKLTGVDPLEIRSLIESFCAKAKPAGKRVVVDITGLFKAASMAAGFYAMENGLAAMTFHTVNPETGGGHVAGREEILWLSNPGTAMSAEDRRPIE
jgi:hypothetical protein